nr:LysR family transcriptional regulator [Bacilli bacterium]
MEIRQLQTFVTVVAKQSFTRAGIELGYTQSTITAHIKELEQEIKAPLFDRIGKRILLTENGKHFLQYAKEILRLSHEAIASLHPLNQPAGTLRIGATETLMVYRLPPVLLAYKKRFPHVNLVLLPSENLDLNDKLTSGEVDLAVITDIKTEEAQVTNIVLTKENLSLVAPYQHPLGQKKSVTPIDLSSETLLLTERGSYRDIVVRWLQLDHGTPSIIDFWSIEAIKQCVKSGLGISYLPSITVREEIAAKRLIALPWVHQDDHVLTQLRFHKDKWLSPAMEEFILLMQQHAAMWQDHDQHSE